MNRINYEGIYRVEAKRLVDEIVETGNYELEKYPHITGVFRADDGELYISSEHYLIIETGGMLYHVEYIVGNGQHSIADSRKKEITMQSACKI